MRWHTKNYKCEVWGHRDVYPLHLRQNCFVLTHIWNILCMLWVKLTKACLHLNACNLKDLRVETKTDYCRLASKDVLGKNFKGLCILDKECFLQNSAQNIRCFRWQRNLTKTAALSCVWKLLNARSWKKWVWQWWGWLSLHRNCDWWSPGITLICWEKVWKYHFLITKENIWYNPINVTL